MAPLANPELFEFRNIQLDDELPILYCFGENLNTLEFLSMLLQTINEMVNVPTMLPIHLAASCSINYHQAQH